MPTEDRIDRFVCPQAAAVDAAQDTVHGLQPARHLYLMNIGQHTAESWLPWGRSFPSSS